MMMFGRWDFIQFGRLVGALIIVGGVAISAWTALDQPQGFERSDSAKYFLQGALQWLFYGGIVIAVTEIAHRMGIDPGELDDGQDDWDASQSSPTERSLEGAARSDA